MAPFDGFPRYGEERGDRIDAATLPPFSNHSRCPQCRRSSGIWVFYCPTCRLIYGKHFHRECRCGAKWDERSGRYDSGTLELPPVRRT